MAPRTPHGPPPLIGRRQILEDLAAALPSGSPASPPGALRLLRGEPGIGKTRILRELSTLHRDSGGTSLIGQNWAEADAPAYWPWTRALSALPGSERATRLHDLVDYDDSSDRFELFDAVAARLAEAAAEAPLLVGIDDIHDADVGTLLLLRFLARELDRLPVLLIAAYRPTEARHREHVAPHIAALEHESPAVDIPPLSPAEVGELIGDPQWADEVNEQTGGNPLFVLHVLRRLANPSISEISGDVRGAVRSTISTVDETTQRALAVVALLGPAAAPRRVASVLEEPPPTVLDRLQHAVEAGLLTADDGELRVSHPVVAEVLVEDLGVEERARLHLAAAEAIGDDPEHAAERAEHLLGAGPGHEAAAYLACRRAAAITARNLAHEAAADHLRRAREVADHLNDLDDVERCHLNLDLGRAMWRSSRRDEADEAFDTAREIALALDDPDLIAHTALGGGYESPTSGEARELRAQRLRQALAVQPPGDSAVRSKLLSHLVTNEDGVLPAADLRAQADAALAMARRVDDPEAIGYALVARQVVDMGPASLDLRTTASREVISLGELCGDAALVLQGRFHLIGALLEAGDMSAVAAELPAHERAVDQVAEPAYARHALWFRCMRLIMVGRATEAEAVAGEAFEVALAASDPDAALVYGGQLAVIRWLQGRVGEVEQLWVDLSHEEPDRALWWSTLAWYWATSGQLDAARGALDRVPDPGQVPDDRQWLLTMVTLAESAAIVGDLDRAHDLRSRLLPYADRAVPISAGISWWGPVARPLGLLAATLGFHEEAERHLLRAIELSARMGARPWVAHAQLDLAAFQVGRGQPDDDTARMAHEASLTIQEWGPGELRSQADRLVERLGPLPVPVERNDPTDLVEASRPPRISVMGTFEVVTPTGDVARWTSRKARELLKVLVSKRGVAVPREELMEILWPGESPERLSNRMSVAISTIRRALDTRTAGPDRDPIITDSMTVRLDHDRVDVDVERFLNTARAAVQGHQRSEDPQDQQVHEALQSAFDEYGGEALPDEPYKHWAELLRAEVRSVIVLVARALAETAELRGDHFLAVRAHYRVLEVDRFDEAAHRGLVRVYTALDAHGQAQAAQADYEAALTELWAGSDSAAGS